MNTPVHRLIQHALRRLTTGLLLDRLAWGTLLASTGWILVLGGLRIAGYEGSPWHGAWMAAAAALLIAGIWTTVTRPTLMRAAIMLDDAAGLKERLSTALAIQNDPDPFAQAAVRDAERTAGHVHVPTHIRYRMAPQWPWSIAMVLAAVILALFLPPLDLFASESPEPAAVPRETVAAEQVAIETKFKEELDKLKKLAEKQRSLDDLNLDLDDELTQMPDEPPSDPEGLRREAVKRIDNVQDQLRKKLDASDAEAVRDVKRMLAGLQRQDRGQQTELSQALADGDFSKAQRELQKMMQELKEAAAKADDPTAQQRLAEMQKKLARLSEQINKLSDTTKLQKDLKNTAGLSDEEARKLLDKLSRTDPKQFEKALQDQLADRGLSQEQIKELARKIQNQKKASQACKQLAQSLSQAAQACQNCQNCQNGQAGQPGASQAAGALSAAASQLSQLEMSEQLMMELEASLNSLDSFREDVCEGGMCPNPGMQGRQYGLGLGERIGKERVAARFTPEKAPTRYEAGEVIGQMLLDGPQVPGRATLDEVAVLEAELQQAEEAIERNAVPRQYDRVVREYFERLAGLARERRAQLDEPSDETAD